MPLFLLFLLVPLIEIGLFIQVGGWIGLWPTLAIVVITAFLGTWLVRSQGREALGRLQSSFSELNDPTEPLAHGAMILFAGALLLTPGFFTDAVGLALMVPGIRGAIFRFVKSRVVVTQGFTYDNAAPREPDIIDGEFEEVDPKEGPSGWTRH